MEMLTISPPQSTADLALSCLYEVPLLMADLTYLVMNRHKLFIEGYNCCA